MSELESWRLFVGAFPPESVQREIESGALKWQAQLSVRAAKWVAREQLHATLCFLGNVSTRAVPELATQLRSHVEFQRPMSIEVQGVGCFPNTRRPRVIWAGLKGEVGELIKLQAAVSRACANITKKPEDKPFSPHITLMRVKELSRQEATAISSIVEREASRRFGKWNLEQICLVRSEISSKGSSYSIVDRYNLKGAK